ncbi:hypothetical protein [Vibrio cholerae]|uniref:hypothetical protein n=1 Tax=Vibrio cholerae TaxID=666 RepID=UPI0008937FBD|nr:hypothetical protein [Vibrio cholerae]EID0060391.1 hypothetical protein [Vibrio vulnificus]EID0716907.1 hypothetical protein [Vibrio vulnificus]EID0740852.1 hypothetical protein [Vibrio vulnificus]EJL7818175.1 hypothetical protein [Vibrio vulnificus]EJX1707120.1 hypothetical protein [Vibrio cholerae]
MGLIMTSDYYFKVTRFPNSNGFHDIFFEANDQVDDFPESIVELKNEFESFIKVISLLFKHDKDSYVSYYEKVYMLSDLAFNGLKEQTFLAKNSLENLKRELVHEVGPRVRTALLFRYINVSVFPLVILSLLTIGIYNFQSGDVFEYIIKLMLVTIGSNIGCWLSLAVRTRSIEFEHILPILGDQKGIHSRIIFVMTFSVVMAILMKSGLISFNVGEFSSASIAINNYSALSFGFIMGFSEKLFVDKFYSKVSDIKL